VISVLRSSAVCRAGFSLILDMVSVDYYYANLLVINQ
jgi:hypothetical protein